MKVPAEPPQVSGETTQIHVGREGDAMLRALIAEHDAILRSDVVGYAMVRGARIEWVNETLARMLGRSAGDLSGVTAAALGLVEADGAAADLSIAALRPGAVARRQLCAAVDGKASWFEVSCVEIDAGRQVVWTFVDITGFKHTERRLDESTAAAKLATATRRMFLATMSHELRTPLNGVLGLAELLASGTTSATQVRDFASTIIAAGESMKRILDDVLDLAKVEVGQFILVEAAFAPAAIVGDVAALFQGTAATRGVVLDARWAGSPAQRYRSDAGRIRQILANLVGNAVKFTPEGRIKITGRERTRGAARAQLEFVVEDTGIGIPAEAHEAVFQAFAQATPAIHGQFGGTGLGLAIVRTLTALMGGAVSVQSELGAGARFEVWLDVGLEEAEPAPGRAR